MLRFSKTFAAAASVELVVSIGKEFLSRREREREREREYASINIISSKMLKQKWQSIQTEGKRERVFFVNNRFLLNNVQITEGLFVSLQNNYFRERESY